MNRLEHLPEFEQIQSDYRPSQGVINLTNRVDLLFLVGPSASGRNTIIRKLVENGGYRYIVSDTTRAMRTNDGVMEQNGVEYFFRDEEDFLERLREGMYLEAAVIHKQQVSGIGVEEVEKAEADGVIGTTDIEIQGIQNIHAYAPNVLAVFVVPPSLDVMLRRMSGRGQLDQDEIHRRLVSAEQEIEQALSLGYFQIVVNDDFNIVVEEINSIAKGLERSPESVELAKNTAWKLLNEIKGVLHS